MIDRAVFLIDKIQKRGKAVDFIWVPSHCGVKGNERADELARKGALKERVDYTFPPPIGVLRRSVGDEVLRQYKQQVYDRMRQIPSIKRYMDVSNGEAARYKENNLVMRREQVRYSRIRLQYRYLWEMVPPNDKYPRNCRICRQDDSHTLWHYIRECSMTKKYRDECDFGDDLLSHFLRPNVLKRVLKEHPGFAAAK